MSIEGKLNITIQGAPNSGKSTMLLYLKKVLERDGFNIRAISKQLKELEDKNEVQQDSHLSDIKKLDINVVEVHPQFRKKKRVRSYGHMIRVSKKYSVEEVLKHTVFKEDKEKPKMVDFDGDSINMTSQRYQNFSAHGVICVGCKKEGTVFFKEKSSENDINYHFNLYAVSKKGNYILMTKDHIKPKSLGGKNTLSNYQTMCIQCNVSKGSNWIEPIKIG